MSVILKSGASGDLANVDTNKALRVTPREPAATVGLFAVAAKTGLLAASLSAAAPLFSFRSAASGLTVVSRVTVSCFDTIAGTAGGLMELEMVIARSFSAADTGGTALTLTGSNQKKRTSYTTSGLTDLRIATTAALGAGTRTLDAQGINQIPFVQTNAAGLLLAPTDLFNPNDSASGYLVFAASEGFIIRTVAGWPAIGTPTVYVRVEWLETLTW